MGMNFYTYIGPYLILPKDFDWYPFDEIVTCGRCESGIDDKDLILIPNQKLESVKRETTFDKHGGDFEVTQINPATIVRENRMLNKLAKPLIDHCDQNDIRRLKDQ